MVDSLKIFITFHIDPELVDQIKAVDPRLEILYDPDLLGKPRYQNDQHGSRINRTPEQEAIWLKYLKEADIIFGYVARPYSPKIMEYAPNLKWVQSPSAGIAQAVKRSGWDKTDLLLTTASGVHATPLAEFCIMSMLMFVKGYFHMAEEKKQKHWQRTCTTELRTKTLAVVGLGNVGSEVAKLGRAMGMTVVGTKRTTEGVDPESVNVDRLYPNSELHGMLSIADFVVLITPLNDETRGLIGAKEIASMKKGSIFINISRGAIVDESALIEALKSGHLGGLAADVFSREPLHEDSPFWDMPNVIISPHSASTADSENQKLTGIFCDNLKRYLKGEPLRNLLNKKLLY